MSTASDHVVQALAHIQSYARGEPASGPASAGVSIAISRQAGAGGPAIAQSVGALLGWPVYDHELLTLIAKDKGIEAQLLEQFDERDVHWLQEMAMHFGTQGESLEGMYHKQLLTVLRSLSKIGHGVVVGRGAPLGMPAATTLRVRLIAPHAVRVANMEKRLGVSRAEAERWVDQTDAERERFVKRHFAKDPNDLTNYDLFLNTSRFSTGDCAALLGQAARLLEARVQASGASA